MKYGYSILLGEHIDALMIDYDDCKSFQIVCPCCKEPVFKVKRDQKQKEGIQYLSHYERSALDASDCELRVNSLKHDDIEKSNAVSRNQKKEYFLKVLRDTVLEREYSGNLDRFLAVLKEMENSKIIQSLREVFREVVVTQKGFNQKQYIYECFDDYIKEFSEVPGGFPKTAFSIKTQKRIAFDMWQYLQSPNAKDNFDFMFHNAYMFLIIRTEEALKVRKLIEYEELLYINMLSLLMKPEEEGRKIIASMMKYKVPPPYSQDLDLLGKMTAEINHEIFGCLLRVPYFSMLKNR